MWHLIIVMHLQTVAIPQMYPSAAACEQAAASLPMPIVAMCRPGLLIVIRRGAERVET